ncbi:HD domain-containing protein [Senegalia sp. (in: firmicutes)]|uniref:HD domain-containing protein n=2 Tax=Senegalia sp. (in: firmicutes) TaxID=1924098 RepID=UPI003F946B1A
MNNSLIDKAIMFATIAHSNQKRKGKEIPYIMHPMEVATIAGHIKYDENIICAALLHDVVEDSQVNIETLEEMFNGRIAELVSAQSEDKTKSWKERKGHTINYLKNKKDEDILIVALADKLANIKSLYRDYCKEDMGENFWNRFNMKDKGEHRCYYSSLIECFKSLDKYEEYNEYIKYVEKVFD